MVVEIEALFPRLRSAPYRITSPRHRDYNCIAWAAGDSERWWWPDADPDNEAVYWPAGAPREESLAAFAAVFAALGFTACDDAVLVVGVERVALFAGSDGLPTHASRQLPNGRWTSKIGFLEDIEHDLYDLEGSEYGAVVRIMRRPVPAPPGVSHAD